MKTRKYMSNTWILGISKDKNNERYSKSELDKISEETRNPNPQIKSTNSSEGK